MTTEETEEQERQTEIARRANVLAQAEALKQYVKTLEEDAALSAKRLGLTDRKKR